MENYIILLEDTEQALNEAALLDIKALDSNLNLLLPFIAKARLHVDENGKIYQVAPKEE